MEPIKTLPDVFYRDDSTFTVFTQSGRVCPYCDRAIDYLKNNNLPYVKFALKSEDILELAATIDHYTVPIIFKGRTLVGGCAELITNH